MYTGNPLPGVANTQSNAPGRNLAIHTTTVFSPNLLNDAGYAFAWGAVLSDPVGTAARKNSPDINPTLPYTSSAAIVPQLSFDYVAGIFGFGSYRDYNKNHTVFDNVSVQHGSHSLKFGGTYNFYVKDENANNYANYYIDSNAGCANACSAAALNADSTFEQNWANFLLGRVNTYSQAQNEFRYLIHQQQYEFYGQDEWRVRPNLTLDYGLRYSLFRAPIFANNLLSTFDARLYDASKAPALASDGTYAGTVNTAALPGLIQGGHNSPYGQAVVPTPKLAFAPRVGFAWDPLGTGKTSVRGGLVFSTTPPR
ncbi:MAG: hypothetical protein NVS9B15_03840 [Acidobacteriaceae bacterium]